MERTPVDIGFEFVEHINRLEHEALCAMMTYDHFFMDLGGSVHGPKSVMEEGWRQYMTSWPHYMIHVSEAYNVNDSAVLVGRTTGSHRELPREEEFAESLIWVARTTEGLVSEWRMYYNTPENRQELGIG